MTLLPLRFSRLKAMAQSARHYLHAQTAEYDSPALRIGRLVHHKVMGCAPEGSPELLLFTGGARKGKAWEKFKAEHPGADIFTAPEDEKAEGMADAIRHDTLAMDLVGMQRAGTRETTLRWTTCGRACQGTPDLFSPEVLVDVKTTRSADPRFWSGRYGELRKRGYGAQLAWYSDAIVACGYPKPERVSIVAVESKAPFVVTVFDLDETELDVGRRTYRTWLEQALVCESSRAFPGYSQAPVRIVAEDDEEMPDLIFSDDEESEAA